MAFPPSDTGSGIMQPYERAVAIQASLREVVLQTAYALRSRTQLAKLSMAGMPTGAEEAATSLEPLGAECTRYLALVRGLRDYLLHAQASLEMELEKATKREAQAAQQPIAEEKTTQQKAQSETTEPSQPVAAQGTAALEPSDLLDTEMDPSISTPPLPPSSVPPATQANVAAPAPQPVSSEPTQAKQEESGGASSSNAIVIDSDDDEDDIPLASAPKPLDGAIDLTDSPVVNKKLELAKEMAESKGTEADEDMGSDLFSDGDQSVAESKERDTSGTLQQQSSDPSASESVTVSSGAAPPQMDFSGMDLSSFGIDMNNLPNLSELAQQDASGSNANSGQGVDLSSFGIDLGSFNTAGRDGAPAGESGDNGLDGIDLSSFDFSSFGGGAGGSGGGSMGGDVNLSAFLQGFSSGDDSGGGSGTS